MLLAMLLATLPAPLLQALQHLLLPTRQPVPAVQQTAARVTRRQWPA